MNKGILLVGALLISIGELRSEVTLSWEEPTRKVRELDAGPIEGIKGTRIYREVADVPVGETSWVDRDVPLGEQRYVIAAYTEGGEGCISERRVVNVPYRVVVKGGWVYAMAQSSDSLTLYPVGRALREARCDAEVELMGHYRIDRSEVGWIGSQRAAVVFARCRARLELEE